MKKLLTTQEWLKSENFINTIYLKGIKMIEEIENIEEEIEQIRSEQKKPQMNLLNQKKLSRYEMDELFSEEM